MDNATLYHTNDMNSPVSNFNQKDWQVVVQSIVSNKLDDKGESS